MDSQPGARAVGEGREARINWNYGARTAVLNGEGGAGGGGGGGSTYREDRAVSPAALGVLGHMGGTYRSVEPAE